MKSGLDGINFGLGPRGAWVGPGNILKFQPLQAFRTRTPLHATSSIPVTSCVFIP
jgi:hypothetical protein